MEKEKIDDTFNGNFLEAMNECEKRIGIIINELDNLCYASTALGMKNLGDKLNDLAGIALYAKCLLSKTKDNKIDEEFKQSQQSSRNLLNVAVAVLNKEDKTIKE